MAEPQMQVSTVARTSQREQIELILQRAKEKGDPLRVRIPFSLYDHTDTTRAYLFVRDATWNLSLPSADLTPEDVETLIDTIGKCLVAIAAQGSEAVLRKLEVEG